MYGVTHRRLAPPTEAPPPALASDKKQSIHLWHIIIAQEVSEGAKPAHVCRVGVSLLQVL